MRKLLRDAVEAVWVLCTAPLRRLIRDAVREALEAHDDSYDRALAEWSKPMGPVRQ